MIKLPEPVLYQYRWTNPDGGKKMDIGRNYLQSSHYKYTVAPSDELWLSNDAAIQKVWRVARALESRHWLQKTSRFGKT